MSQYMRTAQLRGLKKICILTAHTEDSNIFQSMFRRNSVGDMRMYLRKNFEKAAWSEKCR